MVECAEYFPHHAMCPVSCCNSTAPNPLPTVSRHSYFANPCTSVVESAAEVSTTSHFPSCVLTDLVPG